MRSPFSNCLPTVLVLGLASLPLSAQANQAQTQQDIEFARGLAASWGFTDLSERVLQRLEKNNPGGKTGDEIALLKCEIYAISAARIADPKKRDELLKQALTSYEQYIDTHSSAENRPRAESSYIETALAYGRSLAAAAEESAGTEAEAIKKELQDTLTKAVSKTGDLVNALRSKDPRSEDEDRQLFELLMNRASMLLLIAQSQTDGSFNYGQARKTYEEVVDLSGETTSAGLRAFIGVGDVDLAQGNPKDALACYSFVSEVAIPADPSVWAAQAKELDPDEKQRRFALLQLATPGVIESSIAAGDGARASSEGMRFLNIWNREGLDLISPYGYFSLLGIVGALTENGGFVGGDLKGGNLEWFASAEEMQAKFPQKRQQRPALDVALTLAQQINEDNRGNVLSLRAQKLMADIIEQPGVEVSPAILIEAARGKASDRDYLGAIESYKRVLSAIEQQDESVRTEFGSKVLNAIGRSYQALDRPMEAAMVFQEAVTNWLGDPEFESANARGFYDATNTIRRKIKADPLIEALFKKASDAVEQFDKKNSGEIVFRNANALYDEKKYEQALKIYEQVPDNTESYERAIVRMGVAHYHMGKAKDEYAPAIKQFDFYLNKFLKDPMRALGATETRKEAKRREATAEATFWWGLAEYNLAEAGKGDWKRVIELLGGYEDRFPGQDSFSPAAMYRVILAHYHLGNRKELDATYAKLLERYPQSQFTAMAALDVYSMIETEWTKVKDSTDPAGKAKAKALRLQMAEYLEVGNKNASNPAFANLRTESKLWMELGEWAKAEALLTKLVEKYQTGENAEDVQQYVLPNLGEALFMQQKMVEAAKVLGPLVEAKKATLATTVLFARASSGYAVLTYGDDGKPRSIQQIPGVGGKEGFDKAIELFTKLLETIKNREGSFTPPWLEMKFDQIYALYMAGKSDTKRLESAKAQLVTLEGEYGGPRLPTLEDEALRRKFEWLTDQLK